KVNDAAADSNTATLYVCVWSETPSELYATYVAAVNAANDDYLAAVADRDAAILAARAVAQADTDDLYAAYEDAVADAQATYDAGVAEAESAYVAALSDADDAWSSATEPAQATYDAALADAQDVYDAAIATLNDAYDDAIAAADEDYDETVGPSQTARDDAYAAWQADPENEELEAAYNSAQSALDAAIATAESQRDEDYSDALEVWQAGADDAQADWAAAQESAAADYNDAIVGPNDDWVDAAESAWTTFVAAKDDRGDAPIAAEQNAWSSYLAGVASVEDDLATTEASIENQYASAVAAAVSDWQSAEAEAWDSYATALALVPGSPALDERSADPPALEAFAGCNVGDRQEPVFIAQQQEETNLQRLNRLWNEIGTRFTTISQLRAQISANLTTLGSLRGQMAAASAANDSVAFAFRLSDYDATFGQMLARSAAIRTEANAVTERAAEAALYAEGERFRIRGIEARYNEMNAQLSQLANQLLAERDALDVTRELPIATAPQQNGIASLQSMLLTGTGQPGNTCEIARLRNYARNTPGIVALGLRQQVGGGAVPELNVMSGFLDITYRNTLLYHNLIMNAAARMADFNPLLELDSGMIAWASYVALSTIPHPASLYQQTAIAAHDSQGVLSATSAFGKAVAANTNAAVAGPPIDQFARRGIRQMVADFDALLQAELSAIQGQLTWIEQLDIMGTTLTYEDYLEASAAHYNLTSAKQTIQDAISHRPQI
ncbi:MAG: hypothetical protein HYR84_08640, partial [Planctomycetes bacterium]|nr:hypothetical protein [Planctomycetota bacterium]